MCCRFNLIAALLLAGAASVHAATAPVDEVAAIVDSEAIMASEVDQRVARLAANARGEEAPPPEKLRKQALEGLILESIQMQLADRAGVRVGDDQLNQTMEDIAQQNGLNLEQFKQMVEREGQSYPQIREQIRREMVLKRLEQGYIASKIKVTDQEVEGLIASERGKELTSESYHLHHLMLEIATDAPAGTLEKGRAFMKALAADARSADFADLAKRRPPEGTRMRGGDLGWRKQLPGIFADVAPKLAIGEVAGPLENPGALHLIKLVEKRGGAQRTAQQTLVRHILVKPDEVRDLAASEKFAATLRERILRGEDFASIAKEFSDDSGSALEGGDLGWVESGQMVPEFEKMMNATAAGQISRPFRTKYGWHLLEVRERRAHDVSQVALRQIARNSLYKRKYDEELQSWLRRIRDEAYVEIKQ